jgi:hypothetical protein
MQPSLDSTFAALANPTRRAIPARLVRSPASETEISQLRLALTRAPAIQPRATAARRAFAQGSGVCALK